MSTASRGPAEHPSAQRMRSMRLLAPRRTSAVELPCPDPGPSQVRVCL
jgi:hypothetical protein